jgi:hypothetical protein
MNFNSKLLNSLNHLIPHYQSIKSRTNIRPTIKVCHLLQSTTVWRRASALCHYLTRHGKIPHKAKNNHSSRLGRSNRLQHSLKNQTGPVYQLGDQLWIKNRVLMSLDPNRRIPESWVKETRLLMEPRLLIHLSLYHHHHPHHLVTTKVMHHLR